MRPIDKFILHVVHNWDNGLKEAYSAKVVSDLLTKFKDEADDLNIQITDAQLKAYIERFDHSNIRCTGGFFNLLGCSCEKVKTNC